MTEYLPIIGLEIHLQLKTKSKMFCSCKNSEEAKPNLNICPVCMGHPGTLPVVNGQALEWGVLAGLALNCKINKQAKFDRKNYFYPDLPKGYQISQYDLPLAEKGYLDLCQKRINITRVHLEEDAAKLLHAPDKKSSLVDYNRAGAPLLEIVTEPDLKTPAEAKLFMQELRLITRYLGISEADMEKGNMRCDANISLQKTGTKFLNPKTEIKNLNSFRSVERAMEYEIKRQTKLWKENNPPQKESTRGWNENKQITEEQRFKEGAQDYRYFPEPDLPLFYLEEIEKRMKLKIPELPQSKRKRFMEEYGLAPSDAKIITDDLNWANYFEKVISELRSWLSSLEEIEGTEEEIWEKNQKKLAKLTSNWLINKLGGLMAINKIDIRLLKITPENFAEFIALIYKNTINSKTAQTILEEMLKSGEDPSQIMEDKKLGQMDNQEEIEEIVKKVLKNNPQEVERYKKGENQLLKFFLGMVMRESEGKVNPKTAMEILKEKLK